MSEKIPAYVTPNETEKMLPTAILYQKNATSEAIKKMMEFRATEVADKNKAA